MEILNNTYLKFIDSKHFLSWDVKSFFLSQGIFKENIPFVFFGEFLSKYETTKIHIEDNKIYKILGVRTYGNGVFINREVKGNTLNMRTYQLADENTLFWCKVDTKNGGFGIVKKEHEGGLGSSNMFFAKIDINKINPEYLQLLFKSPQIHSYMDQFVTGTTNRKYIKPDQLLSEIKIPLPNLSEQNRIVEEYNKKIQDSINAEIKAGKLEKEIESYLTEELGIEVREKEEKKVGLNFIDFKNLIIWSFGGIKNALLSNKYENISLGDILNFKSGDFLPASNQIDGDFNVYGGNGINGTHKMYNSNGNRLIIGRVGEKCGNIHLVKSKYWVTDNAFITDLIDNSFNLEYLYYVLILLDLNKFRIVSAQPSLSQKNIINIPVPFPPSEIQEKIVKHIGDLKEEIKSLKKMSEDLKESAKVEFEREIFS